MTFFEQQDFARRSARRLIGRYGLVVVGVMILVDLGVAASYMWLVSGPTAPNLLRAIADIPIHVYAAGALCPALVMLALTVSRVLDLRGGGEALADRIGARAVARDLNRPLERRLINVVDELAIASGLRVPRVYVMDDEPGINAFSAGTDLSSAVIVVTRGALETLNRDELQGLIAHEFAHILSGDMRFNLRTVGVLAGIVSVAVVGTRMMRAARQRDAHSPGVRLGMLLLGLVLLLAGYVGLFCARLIKAEPTRARELLADAASVQYTRNPDAIAGALDQTAASGRGTLVTNRYAEDISHMCFGPAVKAWPQRWFATHTASEARIRRVRPGFVPARYRAQRAGASVDDPRLTITQGGMNVSEHRPGFGRRGGDVSRAWNRTAGEGAALVGMLSASKVDFAQRLIGSLPPAVRFAGDTPQGASALLVALMLAGKDEVRAEQLEALRAVGASALADSAQALVAALQGLGAAYQLPMVDLALPVLRSAPTAMRQELLGALEAVIHADRRVSLHAFVILALIRTRFSAPAPGVKVRFDRITAVRPEAIVALSVVAHAGRGPARDDDVDLLKAFRAGAAEMGIENAALLSRDALTADAAASAFANLRTLAPLAQAVLVRGLFAAVTFDGTIRVAEAEMLRLVGAVLDCPLPPLLEDLDPATLAQVAG